RAVYWRGCSMRTEQVSELAAEAARADRGMERLRITPAARADGELGRLRITPEREPSAGRWARRLVLGLAMIATLAAGILAYNRDIVPPWSSRPTASGPETTIVVLRDPRCRDRVTAGGYAVTQSKIHLGSQLTGKIKRITVDKGDRVKPGDLIAELENESYQIELTRARADSALARANADRSRKSFDRTLGLFRRQAI